MKLFSTTILLLFVNLISAQTYLTNKSKYHFAQGAMGIDFQYVSPTGISHVLSNGKKRQITFGGYTIPRIVIGGLHF